MRFRTGFTLIELLSIVAIIAILAAVLIPAYFAANQRAHVTRCMNNLKQLSTAVLQYVADNGGLAPPISPYQFSLPTPNWCGTQQIFGKTIIEKGSLWPYTKNRSIYLCPNDWGHEATGLKKIADTEYRIAYPLSYSMSGQLNRPNPIGGKYRCLKLDTDCHRPSQVLLLIHEARDSINDGLFQWPNSDKPGNSHDYGTTLSYCDGHVRWMSQKQVNRLINMPDSPWYP
jgi:type II secretory pathway pseudopilin PulG